MGLSDRRALDLFKTKILPAYESQIAELIGAPIPFEIKWETLEYDGMAGAPYSEQFQAYYDYSLQKVYFEPILGALKNIAIDLMGKEAVKKGLKKIVIQNVGKFYSTVQEGCFTFNDGVLILDHESTTNANAMNDRLEFLQKLLESKL